MNTLTQEQLIELRKSTKPYDKQWGDTLAFGEAVANAAFALGVAQGKANQIAIYEKAERFERMLMGRL